LRSSLLLVVVRRRHASIHHRRRLGGGGGGHVLNELDLGRGDPGELGASRWAGCAGRIATRVRVTAGLPGHAAWDVRHHRTNRVVVRSLAELCLALDTALAAVR
jgi:hypothetical protein